MNCTYVFKKCSKCGEWLVANTKYFEKAKTGKYGLRADCKKCRKELKKVYNKKKREKKLEEYFIEQRRKELEEKKAKEKNAEAKVTVTEKRCKKCGRILPAEAFYKNKAHKDGLQPYCKECQNEYAKERYYEHIEKYGW